MSWRETKASTAKHPGRGRLVAALSFVARLRGASLRVGCLRVACLRVACLRVASLRVASLRVASPLVASLLIAAAPSFAGTVIVANRSQEAIRFAVAETGGKWLNLRLEPKELVPIPVTGITKCRLETGSDVRRYDLVPDSIYLARASQPDGPRFQRIIFGTSTPLSAPADRAGADWKVTGKPGVIRVKILVDENDVRRSSNWRAKIKQRIEVASKVLEYYCHTRLEVQSYDRWVIDDDVADFEQALTQFEKTVRTDDTDIALGFTSQFALDRKMSHAGGIRGPLRSHILIRDHGLRVSDKGRLEFLLHELGHFFGAAHSPNGNSLMRPVLGDGKANRRDFPLAYDAYNALAMNIFAEQWRRRGVRGIASLEGEARHQLADIYSAMSRLYTSDDTALTLILQVGGSPEYAARALGASIVRVARANERRAATGGKPFEDDDLMAIYVRAAAVFAGKLPKQYARQTFLLGLGVSLDRQNVIGRFSPVARRIESAESAGARQERLRVLGRPTVRGRADLTQHFLASSVLTMTVGTRQAEMAGLLKELADSRGGTGFSSADVTANLAGVEFAKAVLNNELSLQEIARNFHPTLYVPTVVDLEEGLAWEDLVKQFGQPGSEKFQSQLARLRNRVLQTTGFRQLADRKKAGRAPTGDTKNVFGIYENRPERLYEGPPTPSRKSASRQSTASEGHRTSFQTLSKASAARRQEVRRR